MTVKDLIDILTDCDPDLDVVNSNYEDVVLVREETVRTVRDGKKNATTHLILEFSGE